MLKDDEWPSHAVLLPRFLCATQGMHPKVGRLFHRGGISYRHDTHIMHGVLFAALGELTLKQPRGPVVYPLLWSQVC